MRTDLSNAPIEKDLLLFGRVCLCQKSQLFIDKYFIGSKSDKGHWSLNIFLDPILIVEPYSWDYLPEGINEQ